jgi:SAM-dependent methyltransferase
MALDGPQAALLGKTNVTGEDCGDRYVETIVAEGLWSSRAALERYLAWLFANVPLRDVRLLDVGGGTGVFSLYARSAGAREVTSLEPELDGGTRGMNRSFARLEALTGIDGVLRVAETFQRFAAPAGSFDVVLLHNSINHIDEPATVRLLCDEASRSAYRAVFRKLTALLAPGGTLLITDCARTNLFPLLHVPHPISRSIEWHKHQDPGVWAALGHEAGLVDPIVGWSSYNRLGRLGWTFLANRVGAFFTTGHFRLLMRKPNEAAP